MRYYAVLLCSPFLKVKNEVVIWDRIIRRKEDAIINVVGKNKYNFHDISTTFKWALCALVFFSRPRLSSNFPRDVPSSIQPIPFLLRVSFGVTNDDHFLETCLPLPTLWSIMWCRMLGYSLMVRQLVQTNLWRSLKLRVVCDGQHFYWIYCFFRLLVQFPGRKITLSERFYVCLGGRTPRNAK